MHSASTAMIASALASCIFLSALPFAAGHQSRNGLAHPNDQMDVSSFLIKRGLVGDFLNPGSKHNDKMFKMYKAKADDAYKSASERSNGIDVDVTTPLKTRWELHDIMVHDTNGPSLYAKEYARAKYIKNVNRVKMLREGDWQAMKAEADRKEEQSNEGKEQAARKVAKANNSLAKSQKWDEIAAGREIKMHNEGPLGNPLIRDANFYLNKADELAQTGDKGAKYQEHLLRATALTTGSKRLAGKVAKGYSAKGGAREYSSMALGEKSKMQKIKSAEWAKASNYAKKQQEMKRD